MPTAAPQAHAAAYSIRKVEAFFKSYSAAVKNTPAIADFTFGNPHEMPLPGVVDAIKTHAEPQTVDWFAYKTNEVDACEFLAGVLSEELGLPFEADANEKLAWRILVAEFAENSVALPFGADACANLATRGPRPEGSETCQPRAKRRPPSVVAATLALVLFEWWFAHRRHRVGPVDVAA